MAISWKPVLQIRNGQRESIQGTKLRLEKVSTELACCRPDQKFMVI